MDDPQPRNTPPVLNYRGQDKPDPDQEPLSAMRALGRGFVPVVGLLGLAMIILGLIDRPHQSLATAGSILVGAILISAAIRDRR